MFNLKSKLTSLITISVYKGGYHGLKIQNLSSTLIFARQFFHLLEICEKLSTQSKSNLRFRFIYSIYNESFPSPQQKLPKSRFQICIKIFLYGIDGMCYRELQSCTFLYGMIPWGAFDYKFLLNFGESSSKTASIPTFYNFRQQSSWNLFQSEFESKVFFKYVYKFYKVWGSRNLLHSSWENHLSENLKPPMRKS